MFRAIFNLNIHFPNLPKQPWYQFEKQLKIRVIEKLFAILKSKSIETIMNVGFDNKTVWDSSDESEAINVIQKHGKKKNVHNIYINFEHHTALIDYLISVEVNGNHISFEIFGKLIDAKKDWLDLDVFNNANDEFNLYFKSFINAFSNLGEMSPFVATPKIVIDTDNISEMSEFSCHDSLLETIDTDFTDKKIPFSEYKKCFEQSHSYIYMKESLYETYLKIMLLFDSRSWSYYHVINLTGDSLSKEELNEFCKGIQVFNK